MFAETCWWPVSVSDCPHHECKENLQLKIGVQILRIILIRHDLRLLLKVRHGHVGLCSGSSQRDTSILISLLLQVIERNVFDFENLLVFCNFLDEASLLCMLDKAFDLQGLEVGATKDRNQEIKNPLKYCGMAALVIILQSVPSMFQVRWVAEDELQFLEWRGLEYIQGRTSRETGTGG